MQTTRHSQPVTITLPPNLFKLALKIAKEEGRTRSELFREALRKYFWEGSWKRLQAYGAQRVKETGLKEEDIEDLIDETRRSKS
ncbi:MAG: ribbon-helix-helix protein, CopG family [Elusimicrobia bacterium]|nr:ribbon-helix-helix protein, CopG family [Elusimicrobiota bacterium]